MGTVFQVLRPKLLCAAAICLGSGGAIAATGAGSGDTRIVTGPTAARPIMLAGALSPKTNLRALPTRTGIATGARVQSLQGLKTRTTDRIRSKAATGTVRTLAPSLGSNRSFDIDRKRIDNLGLNAGPSDGLKQALPRRLDKKRLKTGAPDTEIARKRQVEPSRVSKTKRQDAPPLKQAAKVADPGDTGKTGSKSLGSGSGGGGRIPTHTPEWTNLVEGDPGDAGTSLHYELKPVYVSSYQFNGASSEDPMGRGFHGDGPVFRMVAPSRTANGEIPEYFEDLSCAACDPLAAASGGMMLLPEIGDQVLVGFSGGTVSDRTPIIAYSHEVVSPRDASESSPGAAVPQWHFVNAYPSKVSGPVVTSDDAGTSAAPDNANRTKGFGFIAPDDGSKDGLYGNSGFNSAIMMRRNIQRDPATEGRAALEPDGLVGPNTSGPLQQNSTGSDRAQTVGANETISVGGNSTETVHGQQSAADGDKPVIIGQLGNSQDVPPQSAAPSGGASAGLRSDGDLVQATSDALAPPSGGAGKVTFDSLTMKKRSDSSADSSSGVSTGKRQHKPLTVSKPAGDGTGAGGVTLQQGRMTVDADQNEAGGSGSSGYNEIKTDDTPGSENAGTAGSPQVDYSMWLADGKPVRAEPSAPYRDIQLKRGTIVERPLPSGATAGGGRGSAGDIAGIILDPTVNRIEMSALSASSRSPEPGSGQGKLTQPGQKPEAAGGLRSDGDLVQVPPDGASAGTTQTSRPKYEDVTVKLGMGMSTMPTHGLPNDQGASSLQTATSSGQSAPDGEKASGLAITASNLRGNLDGQSDPSAAAGVPIDDLIMSIDMLQGPSSGSAPKADQNTSPGQHDQSQLEFLRQRAARNGFLAPAGDAAPGNLAQPGQEPAAGEIGLETMTLVHEGFDRASGGGQANQGDLDFANRHLEGGQEGQPSADSGSAVLWHLEPRVNRIEMAALPESPQSSVPGSGPGKLAQPGQEPTAGEIGLETLAIVHERIDRESGSGQTNQSDLNFSKRLLDGGQEVATSDDNGDHPRFFSNYRPQFYFRTEDAPGGDRGFKLADNISPLPAGDSGPGDADRPFAVARLDDPQAAGKTGKQSLYFPEQMLQEIGQPAAGLAPEASGAGQHDYARKFGDLAPDLPVVVVEKVTVRGWDYKQKDPFVSDEFNGKYLVRGVTHKTAPSSQGGSAAATGAQPDLMAHELAHVHQENASLPTGPVPVPYPMSVGEGADTAAKTGRPLLIIAEDIEGEALGTVGLWAYYRWTM